ncbi:MAG: NTP transferase domain-containing protein [DPANN group archaeon]|nr:NTP transferase domain-containing protein [DPANN group archaeon]
MKERISLTLDKNLVKKVDDLIDGTTIKNRSHAIEILTNKGLGSRIPQKAVILCGGKGTRLRPFTLKTPKSLIKVQEKTLIEHLFDLLKKHGITNAILSVGYLKEKLKEFYKDGRDFGMNIDYVEEDEPLGTAGPLLLLKKELTETFIVTNGDELKDINIEEMYAFHRQSRALATIALTTVDDPSQYGVARLQGSRILEFVEKPEKDKAPSKLINSGFYLLEPAVLDYIPEGFSMLEKDVFPRLAKEGKLFGYPFSGQWFDTGTMERYEHAKKEWRGLE